MIVDYFLDENSFEMSSPSRLLQKGDLFYFEHENRNKEAVARGYYYGAGQLVTDGRADAGLYLVVEAGSFVDGVRKLLCLFLDPDGQCYLVIMDIHKDEPCLIYYAGPEERTQSLINLQISFIKRLTTCPNKVLSTMSIVEYIIAYLHMENIGKKEFIADEAINLIDYYMLEHLLGQVLDGEMKLETLVLKHAHELEILVEEECDTYDEDDFED